MSLPLCVRIDADDKRSAEALKADGWREIEILEIWGASTRIEGAGVVHANVRPATPADNLRCQQIAQKACVFDRLHNDDLVHPADADDFKRSEVNRAFAERIEDVLVYQNGEVRGFIIIHSESLSLHVDLICVDPQSTKSGIGRALIEHAVSTRGAQLHHVRAGTQSHNMPARRLYRSIDMTIKYRLRTFHK